MSITFKVDVCDNRGHSFTVHFSTEAQAVEYYNRKADTCVFRELDDAPVKWDALPELLKAMYPECEHGLGLRQCYGPGHWYREPHEMGY